MIKKTFYKLLLIIILPLILNGCYSNETVDSKIFLRKTDKYKYEIQISVYNEGRGNIHTLDISKYEFESSHWIYLNSKKGKLKASDIVLTYENGKTEYPWKQSNLRGYVEFINDSLLINLKIPIYIDEDEKPEDWSDYKFNGKYKIEVIDK